MKDKIILNLNIGVRIKKFKSWCMNKLDITITHLNTIDNLAHLSDKVVNHSLRKSLGIADALKKKLPGKVVWFTSCLFSFVLGSVNRCTI
jgi:hypothetical protein